MAKEGTSLEQIMSDLKKRIYHPVYFFNGEEPYYIDKITEYMMDTVLTEAEKAFNMMVIYGKDGDAASVIDAARRFPMMSAQQLVILKEAQEMKNFDELIHYIERPLKSTLLVINYKYKTIDKRKKIFKSLEKNAVIFDSPKLYDDRIPAWISRYMSKKNYVIDPRAAMLLTEYLGSDLSKIANELDKLMITINDPGKQITPDIIQANIGISKEFNNFELQSALVSRDAVKANRIVNYFAENQKSNPITLTITALFSFFSKILLIHSLPDKSTKNIIANLKIHPYFVKEYEVAAKTFSSVKTVQIISLLREYDLKSKGFGNISASAGDLLKELVYKIMH